MQNSVNYEKENILRTDKSLVFGLL